MSSTWNCRFSTANLYKALEADKARFQLIDPGSAAGLDASIADAFEKKTGWSAIIGLRPALLASTR